MVIGTERSFITHDNWIHNVIMKIAQLALGSERQYSPRSYPSSSPEAAQWVHTSPATQMETQPVICHICPHLLPHAAQDITEKIPCYIYSSRRGLSCSVRSLGSFWWSPGLNDLHAQNPMSSLLSQYSSPLPPKLLQACLYFGNLHCPC